MHNFAGHLQKWLKLLKLVVAIIFSLLLVSHCSGSTDDLSHKCVQCAFGREIFLVNCVFDNLNVLDVI